MILVSYREEGESGGCRRGCCGPDRVWASGLSFLDVADQKEAIARAAEISIESDAPARFWEHWLIRPATDVEQAGFSEDWTYVSGDTARVAIHNEDDYNTQVKALHDEKAKSQAAAKEASDRKRSEEERKRTEEAERQQLARLKAKYEETK